MQRALPPCYVRSANIVNQTDTTVTLLAKFQQNQQTYTVAPNDTAKLEGTIDMGTWTAVDPLQAITAFGPDNSVLAEKTVQSPGGVQIYTYALVKSGDSVQFVDA